MRTAFISDIHANLEALETVLGDIGKNGVDEIICLGDVVGYGANPNECVELVSERCGTVLLGNHDAAATGLLTTVHFNIHARIAIDWTAQTLSAANKTFLSALPVVKKTDLATFVHATPYEPNMWYYITSLEEAAFNFQFFDTKICLVGHTHIPMIIALENNEIFVHQDKFISWEEDGGKLINDSDLAEENVAADENIANEDTAAKNSGETRLLINIGSVGQPRDRKPESSYGIMDTEAREFRLHRVAYDIAKTQAKMKKIRMPDFLINRLAEGR